jgi:hypothetical protein
MTTPGAGPLRAAVERRSAVLVVYLSGRHRAAVALLPLALLIGLVVTSGPVALLPGLLLLTLVSWLAYLSWPHLPPAPRALRLLGVVTVLALTAFQTAH